MRLLLILLFGILACESDTEKIKRLDGQAAVECLNEEYYGEKYEKARLDSSPGKDTLLRRWADHRAKCELLTREYQSVGR